MYRSSGIDFKNKNHFKMSCQYYHSHLCYGLTLCLTIQIDLYQRTILTHCEIEHRTFIIVFKSTEILLIDLLL